MGILEGHQKTLRRIVVVLLVLAALAERASGRSSLARAMTLPFLRRAEHIAWVFMTGVTDLLPEQFHYEVPHDSDPETAIELALRLRLLAAILSALIAWPGETIWHEVVTGRVLRGLAQPIGWFSMTHSAQKPALIDTS